MEQDLSTTFSNTNKREGNQEFSEIRRSLLLKIPSHFQKWKCLIHAIPLTGYTRQSSWKIRIHTIFAIERKLNKLKGECLHFDGIIDADVLVNVIVVDVVGADDDPIVTGLVVVGSIKFLEQSKSKQRILPLKQNEESKLLTLPKDDN